MANTDTISVMNVTFDGIVAFIVLVDFMCLGVSLSVIFLTFYE